MSRYYRHFVLRLLLTAILLAWSQIAIVRGQEPAGEDEKELRAAGMGTDGPSLL
jgi:hypothetical protein